jgi:hypothetical protein
MSMCLFLSFRSRPTASAFDAELADLDRVLHAIPGLLKAVVYTPSRADDPYLDDGPCPSWCCSSTSRNPVTLKRR